MASRAVFSVPMIRFAHMARAVVRAALSDDPMPRLVLIGFELREPPALHVAVHLQA